MICEFGISFFGSLPRPDIHDFFLWDSPFAKYSLWIMSVEEEGFYPPFLCLVLQKIRNETFRTENRDSHDVPCLPSSPLPSLREELGRQEVNMSAKIPVGSLECPSEDNSDSGPLFVLDTDDSPDDIDDTDSISSLIDYHYNTHLKT